MQIELMDNEILLLHRLLARTRGQADAARREYGEKYESQADVDVGILEGLLKKANGANTTETSKDVSVGVPPVMRSLPSDLLGDTATTIMRVYDIVDGALALLKGDHIFVNRHRLGALGSQDIEIIIGMLERAVKRRANIE